MKQKKNLNTKDVKVTKQDVDRWAKKLTVKSKSALKIWLISGITLVAVGGSVGGYFAYNNIRLREEARNKCTVTFDTNGGSTINKVQVNKGQKIQKPDDPKLLGKSLTCWCFDSELKNPVSFPLKVDNSMTLYAKWDVATFKVDFYTDASEITPYKTQKVAYNKTVEVAPDIPTKEGYKFAGWFTNKQTHAETSRFFYGEGDLGTPITDNLSVYAKWIKDDGENAVVTYDFGKNQRYQYAAKKNELAPHDASYIKKPTYAGYNFIGWLKDFEKPDETWNLDENKIEDDTTLHAAWNEDGKFTVVFSYGDKKSFDIKTVESGKCVNKPEDPKHPGFTFDNWYDKDNNPFDFSTPIQGNIVLHAKWNRCDWNVTEDEYKESFKHLVDIEGVTPVTQDYIADGYCRRTIQKGQEEVIDFNVSRLLVNGDYEECEASGGVDKPYLYTKKQDNFYIYARTDSNPHGTFVGIKETNVRGQLAEVFASIYNAYPYFNIDQELESFVYKYKDEEYDINSTIHFENEKINQLHCDYSHTVGDVTTIYNIHFKYGYDQHPTISFPSDYEYKTEEEKHIHEFDTGHYSQKPISSNTTGDHILSVPSNTTEAGLQYFRCFVSSSNDEQVYIDFVTEDVTVYCNNQLLVKGTDYTLETKDNVKVLYLTNPSEANDNYSVLLHQTTAVDKDVYIGFIKVTGQ